MCKTNPVPAVAAVSASFVYKKNKTRESLQIQRTTRTKEKSNPKYKIGDKTHLPQQQHLQSISESDELWEQNQSYSSYSHQIQPQYISGSSLHPKIKQRNCLRSYKSIGIEAPKQCREYRSIVHQNSKSKSKSKPKIEPERLVREGATSFLESTELNVDNAVAAPAPWMIEDIFAQFWNS